MPANPEVEAYIRRRAPFYKIDPDTAVRVAMTEALNVFDPNQPDLGGDDRSSFGPFQLHYGGVSDKMPSAGLGDEFTRVTGLDARDPSTWPQQVDFALSVASKDGWRQWYGARDNGIPRWAGIHEPGVAAATAGAGDVGGIGRGQIMAQQQRDAAPAASPGGVNVAIDLDSDFDVDDSFSSPLADALADSVKDRRDSEGTGMLKQKPKPDLPSFDYVSAVPAEAPPGQEPSLAAPGQIPNSQLAELFQVASIGGADKRGSALPTIDYGYGPVPQRRRREA